MTATPILAGLSIALASALLAELWWQLLRPRTHVTVMACWFTGMVTRVLVALAGLAICLGLFHLPAPPLVLSMAAGYAVALAIETRITMKRSARVGRTETTTATTTPITTTHPHS
jgi:hypothetical protein